MHIVEVGNHNLMLTAKEKTLRCFYLACEEEGKEPTVGDACRICKTTPFTLIGKTKPSLDAKLEALEKEIHEEAKRVLETDDEETIREWLEREE